MADEVPTEALYDVTTVTPPAVSPAGDRAAFVAREADPGEDERRNSVFVVPTDGSREPHRLTRVSDAGDPAWSPDGSKLGVVMAREEDVELAVGRETPEDDGDDAHAEGEDAGAEGGEGDDIDGGEDDDEEGAAAGGNGEEGPKPQVWVYDLERGGVDRHQATTPVPTSAFDAVRSA